jgi:hypothetical protein
MSALWIRLFTYVEEDNVKLTVSAAAEHTCVHTTISQGYPLDDASFLAKRHTMTPTELEEWLAAKLLVMLHETFELVCSERRLWYTRHENCFFLL